MKRIILALCVIASFNIIAIQLFMTGNMSLLTSVFPAQQALMVSACYVVLIDFVIVYFMISADFGGGGKKDQFDTLFKKYYNGKNYDEAFEKARKEWKKLL